MTYQMVSAALVLMLGSLVASACAPVGLNNNTNAFCVAARPIYITPRDVLDRGTAYDILAHNETGARLCGWQPRSVEGER